VTTTSSTSPQPHNPTRPAVWGREEGYLPISSYGALGDGRTTALVGSDGSVDWWPLPTADSPPVCAAILDAESGGHFRLWPEEDFSSHRRYLEGTNVLETTFETASGVVTVTDAITIGSAGRLPWSELARLVRGVSGEVRLNYELVAGNGFSRGRPWIGRSKDHLVLHVGDQRLALIVEGGPAPEVAGDEGHCLAGSITVSEGKDALVFVAATDDEPLFLPDPSGVRGRMERTIDSWRTWTSRIEFEGEFTDMVRRSALALRLLSYEPIGSIAAASTTSLPEGIGGSKNWDYRYAWVRDSSFAVDSFLRLNLEEEVHASVSWLLDAIDEAGQPGIPVFFTLNGKVPQEEEEIDVPGYRHSRPVRSGNAASGQLQLGVYGDFFDMLHRYVEDGHVLNEHTGWMLGDLADRCCDEWASKDSGIWELGDLQHYTISKIGCWTALDRAVSLADQDQIPGHHASRWRSECDLIRRFVEERCWSSAKGSYTFYADTEELDAAVLLAGRTGFDRGERLASSIDAIRGELGRGPLLYRYSGMDKEEGAFVACSFWLVDALCKLGRADEARSLFAELADRANDLGLFSEQIDPESGEFLGNFPQGLSHLALINAAGALADARRSAGRPGS
jgi:GH15 family glucan-1,4-alpha-glucosidase